MIKYKRLDQTSAFKYELLENEWQPHTIPDNTANTQHISLYKDGVICIGQGFRWDGATMCPDWLTGMLPPLVHDALYMLIEQGELPIEYKADVDRLLVSMVRDDIAKDTNKARSLLRRALTPLIWPAVRLFGLRHAKIQRDKAYDEAFNKMGKHIDDV